MDKAPGRVVDWAAVVRPNRNQQRMRLPDEGLAVAVGMDPADAAGGGADNARPQ